MKKLLATLMCFSMLLSAACSVQTPPATEPTEPTTEVTEPTTEATEPTEAPKPGPEVITQEVKDKLDALVEKSNYQGIVYLTYQGDVVYQSAAGTNDMGDPLTVESPMYLCSVSKQFCAASIMMLRDQGKLSLDDTLEKYFPEFTAGKDITLHHLLSMTSGIVPNMQPMWDTPELYENNTPEENEAAFKEWVFSKPLNFTPGTDMEYANVNYTLLSFIVEMVSGINYEDFVRENIFEPVGMTHSGFITEVKDNPQWGLTYDNIQSSGQVHLIAQGSGGIVSTAGDMDLWMTALQSGKVVSMESFREMTTQHSVTYGYALMPWVRGGWGHTGGNGAYISREYFNEEYGVNLFAITGKATAYNGDATNNLSTALLRTLFEAVDAASN